MIKTDKLQWRHIITSAEGGIGMRADVYGPFTRITILNNYRLVGTHYYTPDGHRFKSEASLISYVDRFLVKQ